MKINVDDKKLIVAALETQIAKVKRQIVASSNQSIKEILEGQRLSLVALVARVSQEPV